MNEPNFDSQFIGEAVTLLTSTTPSKKWILIAQTYGFSDIGKTTYGFRDIFTFKPEDQIGIIHEFVEKAYNDKPKIALLMLKNEIKKRIKEGKINESDLNDSLFINSYLNNKEIDLTQFSDNKYLDIDGIQDSFYLELIDNINKTYRYRIYISTIILIRKLLENLVIEVLRKKYRTNIELYYIPDQGRFQNFSTLVENFRMKLNDYKTIIPSLDSSIIEKINLFRETAHSSAHSLEINLSSDLFENNKTDLIYIIKILFRLSSQL